MRRKEKQHRERRYKTTIGADENGAQVLTNTPCVEGKEGEIKKNQAILSEMLLTNLLTCLAKTKKTYLVKDNSVILIEILPTN